MTSTTGVKYLHIDYRDKYGNDYIVRHNVKGKNFVVWRGNSFELGKQIAEEVAWIVAEGNAAFLDWYDNRRLDYLASIGTNDGSIKSKWQRIIGQNFGIYKVLRIVEEGPTLRLSKLEVQCRKCKTKKIMLYKTAYEYKNSGATYCFNCPPELRKRKSKNGKSKNK